MGLDPAVRDESHQAGRQECGSQPKQEPQMWMGRDGSTKGLAPGCLGGALQGSPQVSLLTDGPREQSPKFLPLVGDDGENGTQLDRNLGVGRHVPGKPQG